jgi:hypothetical protein
MPHDFRETTILDMHGKEQRYFTVPLPFDEAFDLKADLASLVAGPLAAMSDSGSLADLADVPRLIAEKGGSKLVARLLAKTQRVCDGKRRPLSDPEWRTEAYSGGNWVEFYSAVRWVFDVNYGPFLTVVQQLLKGPLGELLTSPSDTGDEI